MEIQISAQKMELTDALREYVNKKVSKIEKFSTSIFRAEVHLSVEAKEHHVSVNLKGGVKEFVSKTKNTDSMYAAIDDNVDQLEKQIRRSK